jgi:sterol desaturase/sphingolipid hydroxylase (fatty acid hydroxylase superfamily)
VPVDVSRILIWIAAPLFLAGMGIELWVLHRRVRPSYDWRDAAASIGTGLGYQLLGLGWLLIEAAALRWLHQQVPWRLDGAAAWLLAIIGVDFMYYWWHRTHHEIRLLWAAHVSHHSSLRYNLSTALRQSWLLFTVLPFLAPLALLGVDAKIVMAAFSINLLYQFWIHTEVIDKLWRPIELICNTPSHHRVHHGSNRRYLDRNYAGILIIWDRLFGTFEPEAEPAVYGLTKNIGTFNVITIEFGELVNIWRDARAARGWRARFVCLLRQQPAVS